MWRKLRMNEAFLTNGGTFPFSNKWADGRKKKKTPRKNEKMRPILDLEPGIAPLPSSLTSFYSILLLLLFLLLLPFLFLLLLSLFHLLFLLFAIVLLRSTWLTTRSCLFSQSVSLFHGNYQSNIQTLSCHQNEKTNDFEKKLLITAQTLIFNSRVLISIK